jgi:prepilin-type N-terminal cleavage/methylation domain-containing protein
MVSQLLHRVQRRWRASRASAESEAGFTLLEMMISVSLFAVFMAAMVPSMFELQAPTVVIEGIGNTQSHVNLAFATLDREVRYASTINQPAASPSADDDWYVEFESTYTGTGICTQLRYQISNGELDQRTWQDNGATATGLSGWETMADGLATGADVSYPNVPDIATTSPFTFYAVTGIYIRQRLGIQLTAVAEGSANKLITSTTALIFTAVDSSSSSSTNDGPNVCQQEPES